MCYQHGFGAKHVKMNNLQLYGKEKWRPIKPVGEGATTPLPPTPPIHSARVKFLVPENVG